MIRLLSMVADLDRLTREAKALDCYGLACLVRLAREEAERDVDVIGLPKAPDTTVHLPGGRSSA